VLEGKALDQFMDRFWGETRNEQLLKPGKSVMEQSSMADTSEDDLEEYELKEDGIIIQPIHKGKIEKRTWIGLIMFLASAFILTLQTGVCFLSWYISFMADMMLSSVC